MEDDLAGPPVQRRLRGADGSAVGGSVEDPRRSCVGSLGGPLDDLATVRIGAGSRVLGLSAFEDPSEELLRLAHRVDLRRDVGEMLLEE